MARYALITVLAACCLASLGLGQTGTTKQTAELNLLRQRAERGDVKAQFELGFMYEFGTGAAQGKRDYAEALKWYHLAAEQGSTDAKHGIAEMYFEGKGVAKDYAEAARWYGCPKPSMQALAMCKEISYKDLPQEALDLLTRMKCDAGPNGWGAAVDLNGDGEPEYEICCQNSSHGPCGAVVIGKVGSTWKELTAIGGVWGYALGCGLFIVLDSRHDGFSDVCLPNQCSWIASANGKICAPTIWQFTQGRYRSVEDAPATSPK